MEHHLTDIFIGFWLGVFMEGVVKRVQGLLARKLAQKLDQHLPDGTLLDKFLKFIHGDA